jgi:ATP-dependent exoDNAse (exonuclease V) beta subunit
LPEEARFRLKDLSEQDFVKELRAMKHPMPSGLAQAVRSSDAIEEAARETCGLVQLACSAWELLENAMVTERALDFTKLEAAAVDLLEQNPSVKERLQKQYRSVLVDESQDLNPIQYRLLKALDLGQSMMVGDAQQSIYGFRQADVRLFQEATEQNQTLNLSRNHRSDQGILAFVDDLFLKIWGQQYLPMGERPDPSDFDAVYTPDWTGVEFWLQQEKSSEQVADWILELRDEGSRLSDIAVLTRGNRFAIEMQSALESRGLPARVVGGTEKFFTRLVVRDVANVLRALVEPYDDFALLAVLRSPFCGASIDSIALLASRKPVIDAIHEFNSPIDEDTERIQTFLGWFTPLSEYADRLPAWETISELYASSGYLEKLAHKSGCNQMIANARKLLTLAASDPELGPLEFAERIREIQEMGHREGDAPAVDEDVEAVTLMTIHKAKGLEFPVVVIPEVHGAMVRISGDVMVDPWLQMVATKFGPTKSFYAAWLVERKRGREEAEEWRLFYVALTRAKKKLCLCSARQARVQSSLAARVAREVGFSHELPKGTRIREGDASPVTE